MSRILLGCCDGGKFDAILGPSIGQAEIDKVIRVRDAKSIFEGYNRIFAEAATDPDLGGLILLHDDVEVLAPLAPVVRAYFQDPDVGVLGTVGGIGYKGLLWHNSERQRGSFRDTNGAYSCGGVGECVDGVDGHVMAFSPWVVRNLRWDEETYGPIWDGYDSDMCFAARRAGKTVRIAPFQVFHRCRKDYVNRPSFAEAERRFLAKWLTPKDPMNLNLGCCDNIMPGYLNVDIVPGAGVDVVADLSKRWPWSDSSVDHVKAHDFIEHLPDRIHTMNEMHRVLRPGGTADIVVPSSDGRGAYQDPTHVSFWNENSFYYYEEGNVHHTRFAKQYGITARFKVHQLESRNVGYGIVMTVAQLEAVK